MDATAIVAIYAALVASAALAWQVYAWRSQRQTRVEVQVSTAVLGLPAGSVVSVAVTATNRSAHAVRVTGLGLDFQDDRGTQFNIIRPLPGSDLPGILQPHDSGSAAIAQEEVEREGIDVYEPITGWVRLATGESLRSEPTVIRSRD